MVNATRLVQILLSFISKSTKWVQRKKKRRIIRRKLRRQERYYTIDEVVDLILTSSQKKDKFSVVRITKEDFVDYNNWWPNFYKRSCLSNDSYGKSVPKAQKITFSISKYHEFHFNSATPMVVDCKVNINGLRADCFRLRNTKLDLDLPKVPVYKDKLPINYLKMEDIKKTLTYIPEEKMEFWNEILT